MPLPPFIYTNDILAVVGSFRHADEKALLFNVSPSSRKPHAKIISNIPDAVSARQLLLDLDLGVQLADNSVAGQDVRWFSTDKVEIKREEEGRGRDANVEQGLDFEGTEDHWDAEVFDMCFCRCGQLAVSKTQRPKSSSNFLFTLPLQTAVHSTPPSERLTH